MPEKTIIMGRNWQAEAPTQNLAEPGCFGVVTNTRFVRCYWPSLDEPVALFADGSGGIEVQGPPTPRNVVFPPDTVFLPIAVNDAQLGQRAKWRETDVPTKGDCFFFRRTARQTVMEEVEVEEEVLTSGGQMVVAKFKRTDPVEREMEICDDLTPEEARAHADRLL